MNKLTWSFLHREHWHVQRRSPSDPSTFVEIPTLRRQSGVRRYAHRGRCGGRPQCILSSGSGQHALCRPEPRGVRSVLLRPSGALPLRYVIRLFCPVHTGPLVRLSAAHCFLIGSLARRPDMTGLQRVDLHQRYSVLLYSVLLYSVSTLSCSTLSLLRPALLSLLCSALLSLLCSALLCLYSVLLYSVLLYTVSTPSCSTLSLLCPVLLCLCSVSTLSLLFPALCPAQVNV